jgi:hypothetical protein
VGAEPEVSAQAPRITGKASREAGLSVSGTPDAHGAVWRRKIRDFVENRSLIDTQ